jgi:hypothetical protein
MLRIAMQKAAQLRLVEKEKNKSPSCAMRVSMRINKVVWSMLADGKSFSEAEINDMVNTISSHEPFFILMISCGDTLFKLCLRRIINSSCQ